MDKMSFTLQTAEGCQILQVPYHTLFAIGYSGRNREKIMEHIHELEQQLSVPAPQKLPTIFQCSNMLLTQEESFHVIGPDTCGEAEYVLVLQDGTIYIGLGSDHTDRRLESESVPKAKQVCPKPICSTLWKYEEIREHFDQIELRSWQTVGGQEVSYQNGTLGDILPPETILNELRQRVGETGNSIIFSGTVPLLGGFIYGNRFRCEMHDPILNRTLSLCYRIVPVPETER